MKLRIRLALLASGITIALSGWGLLQRGIMFYENTWFRGANYSPGTIAVGLVVALLAFVPPAKLFKRVGKPQKANRTPKKR